MTAPTLALGPAIVRETVQLAALELGGVTVLFDGIGA